MGGCRASFEGEVRGQRSEVRKKGTRTGARCFCRRLGAEQEISSMQQRWTIVLGFALVVGGFAGCGGYTNENTPVKVVTDDEMKEMAETNKKIAEMGGLKAVVPVPKDVKPK